VILVQDREAALPQRIVISGSDNADGAHPANVGAALTVCGDAWTVVVEHQDGGQWHASLDRRLPQPGAALAFRIETEDGQDYDYNDLVLLATAIPPALSVERRPFALDGATLQMAIDGIFTDRLGVQYIGVQVTNRGPYATPSTLFLTLSSAARAQLIAHSVLPLDTMHVAENDAMGQTSITYLGRLYVRLGHVAPGASRTIFFKADFSYALASKPMISLVALLYDGSEFLPVPPDGIAPARMFVARITVDLTRHVMIAEVPEGRLALRPRRLMVDPQSWEGGRVPPPPLHDPSPLSRCREGRGARPLGAPLLVVLLDYDLELSLAPYAGQLGPLPFSDPWWKILAALLAWLFSTLFDDETNPKYGSSVATVTRASFMKNDVIDPAVHVDAAVATLAQGVKFKTQAVDVLKGEANNVPVVGMDQLIPLGANAAQPALMMKVAKSGVRSGITHGVVTDIHFSAYLSHPFDPNKSITWKETVVISPDSSVASPVEGRAGGPGDSGAVWFETASGNNDPVALNFSSENTDEKAPDAPKSANAFPLDRVLTALQVKLRP
jgi:hypothetical protein